MEVYFPTLQAKMVSLSADLRFVVFAIMVVGLVIQAASHRVSGMSLVGHLAKAVLVLAVIASIDTWYPTVERGFLQMADYVDPGYSQSPTAAAESVRSSIDVNPNGQTWSWRHLNQSIYQAVTSAMAHLLVYLGTLITVPLLILQYVLVWLLYLLTPFALALLLIPGLGGITVRFCQQVLAIHAWPVGFAMTNFMALSVWQDFRNAVGANPQTVGQALYSPLLTFTGALLGTIMIVVGMVSTPIVMQLLFSQGHAFTGASANPTTIVRAATTAAYNVKMMGSRPAPRLSGADGTVRTPNTPPPPAPVGRPGI